MESDGISAFCPTCGKAYTFYGDAAALDPDRRSDGRRARPCFQCSFRKSRWDVLWIPAFLLVVASFPLLWMIWSNLIGPFVFLAPVALRLWRRARRALGSPSDAGAPGSAAVPRTE